MLGTPLSTVLVLFRPLRSPTDHARVIPVYCARSRARGNGHSLLRSLAAALASEFGCQKVDTVPLNKKLTYRTVGTVAVLFYVLF